MARGWESKSVEDQISEREAQSQAPREVKRSQAEIDQQSKREGMLLARSRTVAALEAAHDGRYRALLQRTLEHLDAELEKL